MKVKVISRNPDEYMRETKHELHRVRRNYDPGLHPFEAAREYTRALNAVKLERVFAKPFVGSLDGHTDGVSCLARHPTSLSRLVSGAFDGVIRGWDLAAKTCTTSFVAHDGIVRGAAFVPDGDRFVTVGDDKTVKIWRTDGRHVDTVLSATVLTGVSHHRSRNVYATCGESCQLWEESRNEPLRSIKWGLDSLHDVAFNQSETELLACCAGDRSVILYDTRDEQPLRKVVMTLRANKLAWNPMEPYVFTCASEDYNLYTFDTRNLNKPVNVHMDHVGAVTCVDYSPTGREFVSGSYDKSIRIFQVDRGHSREIYHTKRMQRLTTVLWTLDDKYVISGSDEMNIRIWKARASEKLGPLKPRERTALNYAETLKEKYASHPEVKRIARHRHVPRHIYNAQGELRTIRGKAQRKEANRRRHSKPGTVPFVPERERHVVREEK